MLAPNVIIFAIRAGMRLGQEARQAYIDQTKQRKLTLTLPKFDLTPPVSMVIHFFDTSAKEFLTDENPRLVELHSKAKRGLINDANADADVVNSEREVYLELRTYFDLILTAKKRGGPITSDSGHTFSIDEFTATMNLKQWEKDDPANPQTLHRFAGTIIEIGIDYFATSPSFLDANSSAGKVVAGFARALDDIQFSEILVKEDAFDRIVARLLVAALETASAQSELITNDDNYRDLVRIATRGVANDIQKKLHQLDDDAFASQRVGDWGELIFRSLLSNAGQHVIDHPARYLGVSGEPQGKLIAGVGSALIELAVEDEQIKLRRIFSQEGLDTVIRASLAVVAQYPELVADTANAGLKGLIKDVALTVSQLEGGLITPDIAPRLIQIILEKSAANLPMIWPDLDPDEHLLLTAGKATLQILTQAPDNQASWKLQFRTQDVLTVIDSVVDELANNPAWLVALAEDQDKYLGSVLRASLQVLRTRADERLSLDLATDVLQQVVGAIVLNAGFVEKIHNDKPFIAAALDLVFAEIFQTGLDRKAQWQLIQTEAVQAIVGSALTHLAGSTMNAQALSSVTEAIQDTITKVTQGQNIDWEVFDLEMAAALS